ncbi:hypothetical protein Q9966_008501 [Columba livia]|nr:hypothetical protein Q9966_008501 [Columba livia]
MLEERLLGADENERWGVKIHCRLVVRGGDEVDYWKIREAFDFLAKDENQKAVDKLSSVIKLNPHLARISVFLQLQEPTVAFSDCNRAIKLNLNSAPPYEFRGKALQLLGHLKEVACNISLACKFDSEAQAV